VRTRSLTALLAASFIVAGCGGDDSPKREANTTTTPATTGTTPASSASPDATVRRYFSALSLRDGDLACTLLSKQAQRKALATVEKSRKKQYKTCGLALADAVSVASNQQLQSLELKITKSTVDGARAKVRVEGGKRDIALQKVGNRWVITDGIG